MLFDVLVWFFFGWRKIVCASQETLSVIVTQPYEMCMLCCFLSVAIKRIYHYFVVSFFKFCKCIKRETRSVYSTSYGLVFNQFIRFLFH